MVSEQAPQGGTVQAGNPVAEHPMQRPEVGRAAGRWAPRPSAEVGRGFWVGAPASALKAFQVRARTSYSVSRPPPASASLMGKLEDSGRTAQAGLGIPHPSLRSEAAPPPTPIPAGSLTRLLV